MCIFANVYVMYSPSHVLCVEHLKDLSRALTTRVGIMQLAATMPMGTPHVTAPLVMKVSLVRVRTHVNT